MSKFGMYVKFTTHEGQLDALIQNLFHASQILQEVEGCELYLINISPLRNQIWYG